MALIKAVSTKAIFSVLRLSLFRFYRIEFSRAGETNFQTETAFGDRTMMAPSVNDSDIPL